jgi:hypothetical protein
MFYHALVAGRQLLCQIDGDKNGRPKQPASFRGKTQSLTEDDMPEHA